MDTLGRNHARVAQLDLEGTLFRAALLAGYGGQAQDLAARMTSICQASSGRSCVEAGAPVQLLVEAPGEAELSLAIRMGGGVDERLLGCLMPEERAVELAGSLARLPGADHLSLGFWLFWSRRRQSIFADLRDPDPARAIERLRPMLLPYEQRRLDGVLGATSGGRPWGLSVGFDEAGRRRMQFYWFMSQPSAASSLVDRLYPGGWRVVVEVLGILLALPGQSGRWLLAIPLDSEELPCLWLGNSAWGLVPEDERKHRAIAQLMSRLGGPRAYAEALWSFCRGAAPAGWRVGRTCEVGLREDGPRARLLLTPQVEAGATAGISNSDSDDSNTAPMVAEPLSP